MERTAFPEQGTLVDELPAQQQVDQPFEGLTKHKHINLTTFRRNRDAVTTPVWFVRDADRLYVTTALESGKVKRIRNNPEVRVVPSTATGKPLGAEVSAFARILPNTEEERAALLLREKYSWALRVFEWMSRLRGEEHVYLEIVPAEVDESLGSLP
ncbi:MAG: PPOX class F420-dependent oxidoreductase [Chloroflexota bacterium]|nr:PPOX class F420-dependent oxidoreductase [Chloroflexota bacterium]